MNILKTARINARTKNEKDKIYRFIDNKMIEVNILKEIMPGFPDKTINDIGNEVKYLRNEISSIKKELQTDEPLKKIQSSIIVDSTEPFHFATLDLNGHIKKDYLITDAISILNYPPDEKIRDKINSGSRCYKINNGVPVLDDEKLNKLRELI